MEDHLISRLRKNCSRSQKIFYELHARKMFLISFRFVNNEQDAESIVNKAFYKAFKNISQYKEIKNKNIEMWLRRIVVNESIAFINSVKNLFFTEDLEIPDPVTNCSADRELSAEDYYNLIRNLPDGYRTIFNLYAIEGYSHKEIAKMLNIKESTSRSQLTHARAILQKQLKKI